jgi:hypothetical protein
MMNRYTRRIVFPNLSIKVYTRWWLGGRMGRASSERYDCVGLANGLAELPDRELHISDYRDNPQTGTTKNFCKTTLRCFFSNDRGVEQTGKREDERSLSSVYKRAERK